MKNLEKRIEIAKDFYVSGNGKKYVVDIDATLNDCLKQITELKQRLARYENPDYVLVPKNSKTVVAIENMVYQQVEASGIDEPIHRLDGWRILDAIEESLEKDHAQQDS